MIYRYARTPRINFGTQMGVSNTVVRIRNAVKSGEIPILSQITLTGNDRLDSIAGDVYGDSRYWWILAAASDIGWSMQVPPGTLLNIVDLSVVSNYLS